MQVISTRYLLAQKAHYIISYEIVKTESEDINDKESRPDGSTQKDTNSSFIDNGPVNVFLL
jgi:hypothetical protein